MEVINENLSFGWRPLPYTLSKLCQIQIQMVTSMDISRCFLSKHVALLSEITTHHMIRSIISTTSDLKTTVVKGGAVIRGCAGN
jgi:hypothetical protein